MVIFCSWSQVQKGCTFISQGTDTVYTYMYSGPQKANVMRGLLPILHARDLSFTHLPFVLHFPGILKDPWLTTSVQHLRTGPCLVRFGQHRTFSSKVDLYIFKQDLRLEVTLLVEIFKNYYTLFSNQL